LEREQALQSERSRIARDLHDDLGANLTGIALKADVAQRQLHGTDTAAAQLADIATSTRALVDNMRETVWALNPKHDTLESLARFLAQQVETFVTDAELRCRLELPDQFPAITVPSPARYHIHMVVKEALHNAVKHAGAHEVHFSLNVAGDDLLLRITDDGHGFNLSNSQRSDSGGNGLPNMRQRVESLGGELRIASAASQGTSVLLQIPLQSFQAKPT
jgi:signal transduction histidine kinase